MISFDTSSAPILYIDLDPAQTDYTAREIYSRWKEWVLADNANWPPAFRTIGGDDLGENRTFPSAYFLRNDRGWLLRKPVGNGEYRIDGNLLAQTSTLPTTAEPVGAFTPTIRINLENVSGFDISELLSSGNQQVGFINLCPIDVEVIPNSLPAINIIDQAICFDVTDPKLCAESAGQYDADVIVSKIEVEIACPC